mgnify:CR=1 FL=1
MFADDTVYTVTIADTVEVVKRLSEKFDDLTDAIDKREEIDIMKKKRIRPVLILRVEHIQNYRGREVCR